MDIWKLEAKKECAFCRMLIKTLSVFRKRIFLLLIVIPLTHIIFIEILGKRFSSYLIDSSGFSLNEALTVSSLSSLLILISLFIMSFICIKIAKIEDVKKSQ